MRHRFGPLLVSAVTGVAWRAVLGWSVVFKRKTPLGFVGTRGVLVMGWFFCEDGEALRFADLAATDFPAS